MRTLLQLVMMAALLLSGDAFGWAAMPCCTTVSAVPMRADMPMPVTGTCHGADVVEPSSGRMEMLAAPMMRCPRAHTGVQAASEWTRNEQAETSSPLHIAVSHAEDNAPYVPRDRALASLQAVPTSPDASSSLPLRI